MLASVLLHVGPPVAFTIKQKTVLKEHHLNNKRQGMLVKPFSLANGIKVIFSIHLIEFS